MVDLYGCAVCCVFYWVYGRSVCCVCSIGSMVDLYVVCVLLGLWLDFGVCTMGIRLLSLFKTGEVATAIRACVDNRTFYTTIIVPIAVRLDLLVVGEVEGTKSEWLTSTWRNLSLYLWTFLSMNVE